MDENRLLRTELHQKLNQILDDEFDGVAKRWTDAARIPSTSLSRFIKDPMGASVPATPNLWRLFRATKHGVSIGGVTQAPATAPDYVNAVPAQAANAINTNSLHDVAATPEITPGAAPASGSIDPTVLARAMNLAETACEKAHVDNPTPQEIAQLVAENYEIIANWPHITDEAITGILVGALRQV